MNHLKTAIMLLLGARLLNAGYITPPLQAVLDTLSSGIKFLTTLGY